MFYTKEKVQELRSKNLLVFEEPNHIKIELSTYCNLECEFCGKPRTNKGFMTEEIFEKILKDMPSSVKRVDFSMHGEPTLHPKFPFFLKELKQAHPHIRTLLITNIETLKRKGFEKVLEYYGSGLNFIMMDLYSKENSEWLHQNILDYKEDLKDIKIVDFYKEKKNPWNMPFSVKKALFFVEEYSGNLEEGVYKIRKFHTFGGNIPFEIWQKYSDYTFSNFPIKKVCTEPLKILVINQNGDIPICCQDGGKSLVLGNILQKSILEIWHSKEIFVCRFLLHKGLRHFLIPCVLCPVLS
ncbi:MAG: SPASM domain-containing protein, partial [Candidatus Pacearchaeota archaeon]